MKNLIIIFLALVCSQSIAQKLNRAGHFSSPAENTASYYDSESGKNFIETKHGFIFMSDHCESLNEPLIITDKNKNPFFNRSFRSTVNLILSPGKSFCAFHDLSSIQIINLKSLEIKSFEGSNLFDINDAGDVIFYNESKSFVCFNDQSFSFDNKIYKVRFFKEKALFVSKFCIYELSHGELLKRFCSDKGRIFDIAEFENSLFVSVKEEFKTEFIFTSYKSSDLTNFIRIESVHHDLINYVPDDSKENLHQKRLRVPAGEMIRDPLNFFSDTVYQPVGNSYCEIQDYLTNSSYLHPGVDLLGLEGQDVHSVKNGFVRAVLTTGGPAYWRIAISNENISGQSQGYLYAHLNELTIPYAVDDSVFEGDIVGQLELFPFPNFNHCHFARIVDSGATWYGAWWTYNNPLCYMTNLFDSVAPQFEPTGSFGEEFAFRDLNGNHVPSYMLQDKVQVISKFYDNINSIWKVDVNNVRYSLSAFSTPQILLIDTFAYEFNFYNDEYGVSVNNVNILNTIYARDSICYSLGNYSNRDFYHIVTNSDGNDTITGNDSIQYLNTLNFPDGDYIFRIIATDASGNSTVDSMYVGIINSVNIQSSTDNISNIEIFPNPSEGKFRIHLTSNIVSGKFEILNNIGQRIMNENIFGNNTEFNLPEKGVYLVRITLGTETIVKKIIRL